MQFLVKISRVWLALIVMASFCPLCAASAPTLALTTTQTQVTAVQGQSVSNTFTITTGGSFSGAVTLSVSGLPSGVTTSWSQSTFTPKTPVSTTTSTLKFQTAASLAPNWYTYSVTAAGDGLSVTWSYTLIVTQAPGLTAAVNLTSFGMTSLGTASLNVIATPSGGLSTTSALTHVQLVSGLPTGITVSYGTPVVASSGAVTYPLTFTGSTAALGSKSTLSLTVSMTDKTSGLSYTATTSSVLTVTYVMPTLSFSAASTKVTTGQGGSVSNVFTFVTGGSFHGLVKISLSGLPSGVTASWSSSSFTPATPVSTTNSTLTLKPNTTLAPNWYTYSVTAAGDGLSVTWNYTLVVTETPGMTASVNLTSFSMTSLGSATLNVIAAPYGGLSTTAALTHASLLTKLPTGITATYGTPVVSSGVVTCPVSFAGSPLALGSTTVLNFSISVTDQNTHVSYKATTSSTLKVVFVPPTLTLTASSTKLVVLQTDSIANIFTIATGGSFHGPVTLSVSGLPSGVTGKLSKSTFTPASATSSTTATLTFSVGSAVSPQWYRYTVTAAGDGLSVTWTYTLIVDPLIGMSSSVSSPALDVNQHQPGSVTVTAAPLNAITIAAGSATVAIASKLPSGITATFGSPVTNSNGTVSWQLNFSVASGAASGNFPVTIALGIADSVTGMHYQVTQPMSLLVSLLADVTVGSTPGAAIPSGFLGLSHEWKDAQTIMGSNSAGVNNIYRQLIGNLTAYNTGLLNLRIGGNSTDLSTEPTSTTVVPFAQLTTALPVNFDLGVNLGSDNVNLAVDQATAYLSQMPSGTLKYIEIGNEPNLYIAEGKRPKTYTYADFLADFTTWSDHLAPVLPATTKLMGPAWAGYQTTTDAQSFMADQTSSFGAYSNHYYAFAQNAVPSADCLLTKTVATTLPVAVVGPVAAAHAANFIYRVGELGPVDHDGAAGVSNGFQSALWSVDLMFGLAQNGVDGVNWESSNGNLNIPFVFNITAVTPHTNSYALSTVRPLYYGLLMFQQAVANQAQLMPVTTVTGANLSAWATLDSTAKVERVVLLNKDENFAGAVTLIAPGYSTATVTRLEAASYSSTTGVTLGGQTFDGSPDGTIQGTLTKETYTGTNGVFQFNMPLTSGALVVLSE